MATIIKAYYDGAVFVPLIPVDIPIGKEFVVSVLQEELPASSAIVKQIAAFKHITQNLRKINDNEPLPAEFDEIMSQRIHFKDIV